MLGQEIQEIKFLTGKRHFFAFEEDLAGFRADIEIADDHAHLSVLVGHFFIEQALVSSQLGAQVCHQHGAAEGLHDVVISPKAQASHDVSVFGASGSKDDGGIGAFTELSTQRETILSRQHDVQNDGIDFLFIHDLERSGSVAGYKGLIPGTFEEISFHVRDLWLVFHYKYFCHFVLLPSASGISKINFKP